MTKGKRRRQKERAEHAEEARKTAAIAVNAMPAKAIEKSIEGKVADNATTPCKEDRKMAQNVGIAEWCKEYSNVIIAGFTAIIVVLACIQTGIYSAQLSGLKVSQRAFIFAKHANIIGIDPSRPSPPNAPQQLDVTFGNSGQTWARNESGSINFYFSPAGTGIPDDFTYPVDNHSQPVLIAPQAEAHLLKAIPEDKFADVISRRLVLFVYGDISYQDVFGAPHHTEYLFQYAGYELTPDTGKIVQYIFFQGPTHNCADEDCQPQKAN